MGPVPQDGFWVASVEICAAKGRHSTQLSCPKQAHSSSMVIFSLYSTVLTTTSGWGIKGFVSCCWPLPPTSKQAHQKKINLLTKQPFVIIRRQALTTVLQDFPVILTDSRFRGTPTLPWLSHLILQKAQLAEAFYNLRTTTSSSNLQSSSQKYTLLRNLFQLKLKGIWNSF